MIDADKLRVFVIEDSIIDFRMLHRRLTRDGFCAEHIFQFENLEGCHKASLANPPDVMFLDLNIKESAGIETFERFIEFGFEVPVVVLSGKDDLDFARGAVRLGAQDYIVKSQLRNCNLKQTIGYALDRFALVNEVRQHAEFKSKFLAHMSHEIRTPLNGVMGLTEILLQSKNLTSDQLNILQTIAASGRHLISIVSNVLDLSKLEANRMDQELKRCDIRATIDEVLDLFLKEASLKSLTLATQIASAVPKYIYSDPRHLKQVLINLVGNAVKFTEQGCITVAIKAHFDSNEFRSGAFQFTVQDTGPGISLVDQERLFSDYQQLVKDKRQGTGLGLAISQSLIRLLGGEITLTSAIGEGSSFSFALPLSSEYVISPKRQGMQGKRALVLSSSETRGHLIKKQLEKRQLKPYFQRLSACQSVNRISVHERFPSFDILIFDTYGTDELLISEFNDHRQRIVGDKPLPVVSIHQTPQNLSLEEFPSSQFKLVGALSETKLYRAVARALGELPSNDLLEETSKLAAPVIETEESSKVETTAPENGPNMVASMVATTVEKSGKAWSVLVADDNSVNRMVARKFLELMGHTVEIATDGSEAVEAVTHKKFDLVLMDCKMPGMDGLEATKVIRNLPSHQGLVPICAVTANAFEEDRQACLDSGMDFFVTKPLTLDNLSAVIAEATSLNQRNSNFVDAPTVPTSKDNLTALIDIEVLTSLKELNSASDAIPFLDDLIGVFLEEAPAIIDGLIEAATKRDSRKTEYLAHKLKGFARNLGATQLAALCEDLERLCHTESFGDGLELARTIGGSYQTTADVLCADWLTKVA